MNREIKFRGKRVDNGEWVYGDLIHGQGSKHGKMYILPQTHIYPKGCHELDGWNVVPETVGQSTGLPDRNSKKIYEGDIILATHIAASLEYKCVVEWRGDGFVLICDDGEWAGFGLASSTAEMFHIHVIGNIHDNQELLSEK